ncbi:hypothetical protein H6A05_05500 [Megasphaera elsdenii]|uniref:hypothetical protein n=1 Tax=Megasphaera elsdenii TaxID=907 RepID=UPI00195A9217|nr:hypothetical protein [Megasphaera elsdenii]MBM6701762.1 hypothetical protein [Megasphaera elsdenii]
MKYITADEAVAKLVETAKTLHGEMENEGAVEIYARHIVGYVLDYCHRKDFPSALVLTGAALIGAWLDDAANGGRNILKSIKQNDTEFQFAVGEAASAGSPMDADLEALHPKLNMYRKVRWPTCPCPTSGVKPP